MPARLDPTRTNQIVRLLLLQWKPDAIAAEVGVNVGTVYRIERNLMKYSSAYPPPTKKAGRPEKITPELKERMRQFLHEHPTALQRDLVLFLSLECGIKASQPTVSRLMHDLRKPPSEVRAAEVASEAVQTFDAASDSVIDPAVTQSEESMVIDGALESPSEQAPLATVSRRNQKPLPEQRRKQRTRGIEFNMPGTPKSPVVPQETEEELQTSRLMQISEPGLVLEAAI